MNMKRMYDMAPKICSCPPAVVLASILLFAGLNGCSEIEIGGGSSVVPEVTVLPPELGSEAAAAAGTAGDATATTSGDASPGGGVGTIRGRVVLTGTAPSLPPLFVKDAEIKDKEVCAEFDLPDERLVLGTDKGVANVFVYLKKKPKGTPKVGPAEVALIFDQKNCRFLPHCLIVRSGQTVKVLSGDSIAHNTHTNPLKNQSVSTLVAPGDREGVLKLVYSRAEDPFSVTCDLHGWMKAYHLPLDHPYGAVTDENGNFEIVDIPAGNHDVVVWHESAKGQKVERGKKITVQAGENSPLEIPYSVDKLQL
jgi:hypothetical protein